MPETIELKTTIGDLLDSQTKLFGDREALVHVESGSRFTYNEFKEECDQVARGLMALGIEKGHHVGIWVTNYSEWVVSQFATAKIGAVLVTVNPSYRTHELEYVLKQSEANALILIGQFRTSDYVIMANEVVPELKDSAPGNLKSPNLLVDKHWNLKVGDFGLAKLVDELSLSRAGELVAVFQLLTTATTRFSSGTMVIAWPKMPCAPYMSPG